MIRIQWVVKSVAQWVNNTFIVLPRRAGASEESFCQKPTTFINSPTDWLKKGTTRRQGIESCLHNFLQNMPCLQGCPREQPMTWGQLISVKWMNNVPEWQDFIYTFLLAAIWNRLFLAIKDVSNIESSICGNFLPLIWFWDCSLRFEILLLHLFFQAKEIGPSSNFMKALSSS